MAHAVVTIGIPACKGAHFGEALECWKSQTFTDFDVFIQDDCSNDDLHGIYKSVCGNDPRFHFERNDRSTYPNFVDNWQRTLDKADGEFFVLASDDDIYDSNFLEELIGLARKYPEVNMFDAYHDLFGESGIVLVHPRGAEFETQIEWIYSLVCFRRYEVAQSVMVRTQALREIGGFVNLPAAWGACDWLTWCRLARNGVVNSSKRLMHWRLDGGNTTENQSSESLKNKILALQLARPLWERMADGLVGSDDMERFMVERIQIKIHHGYIDWLAMPTLVNLPLFGYIRMMWMYVCNNDITHWRFLLEACRAIKRMIRRH